MKEMRKTLGERERGKTKRGRELGFNNIKGIYIYIYESIEVSLTYK